MTNQNNIRLNIQLFSDCFLLHLNRNKLTVLKRILIMKTKFRCLFFKEMVFFIIMASVFQVAAAKDIIVKGTVTDEAGALLMDAGVSFFLNATEYRSVTGTDGSYSVRISGAYSDVPEKPVIINSMMKVGPEQALEKAPEKATEKAPEKEAPKSK